MREKESSLKRHLLRTTLVMGNGRYCGGRSSDGLAAQ